MVEGIPLSAINLRALATQAGERLENSGTALHPARQFGK